MMPLSFQGFGFTGIVIMVAVLAVSHLLKYLRRKIGGW
jgi:hypothetical protein